MTSSEGMGRQEEVVRALVLKANERAAASGRERLRNFRFLWRLGGVSIWFNVVEGQIVQFEFSPGIGYSWDFAIGAPDKVWMEFLRSVPKAPYHHLFGMWAREPTFVIDGNREILVQNAAWLNEMMRIARGVWNEGNPRGEGYEHRLKVGDRPKERISGGYWRIPINGEVCRIYIEEAGQGRDLLLLHTAGSDTRQFYHLLNSDLLASNWRMIAFDMPGHGKSLPPPSWRNKEYRLTGAAYLDTVLAVMECLDLRRPVVFGCSMAGALCLQLAYRYPSRCRAVIACEAADQIPARLTDWLRHPRVDSAEFAPEWIDGLISPLSPDMFRREILWEYSQAAAGVFYGDVAYYSGEFAISSELGRIDTDKCPIYLLTGEYDYSCTPAMSRATAERIKGAHFTEMKGLGHFPMAENPEGFMSYMLPILAEIRTRDAE